MADALWLDTSVLRAAGGKGLEELAQLARQSGVRVVIHAHIHLERCRQLRQWFRARGREFTPSYVRTSLDQLGIEVADAVLDRESAETWAALLDVRHATEDEWRAAKLQAVGAALPVGSTLPAESVPMTTDWLVALEVERQGACVAVADKGIEWAGLRAMNPCRAMTYDDAMEWLRARATAAILGGTMPGAS